MSRNQRNGRTVLVIDKVLTIPDSRPDIEFPLRITPTAAFSEVAGGYKKIEFAGLLTVYVEYVASHPGGMQPIHFASLEVPFDGVISHRYARSECNAQLRASMVLCEFQKVSPREVKLVINLKADAVRLARANQPIPSHIYKPYVNLYQPDNLESFRLP